MATLEERLAFLEGRVDEQSQMVNGIREAVVSLEQRTCSPTRHPRAHLD